MKHLLLQFFFGIDTIIALASFTILTIVFDVAPFLSALLLSFVFAYLPDFDLIIFFIFRKRFDLKSHWVIGHHPIFIIPLATIFTWILLDNQQSNKFFILSLCFINVISHFLHESVNPIGFHWFSPFSWKRYVLRHGWFSAADPAYWDKLQLKLGSKNTAGNEIALRLEKNQFFKIVTALLLYTVTSLLFLGYIN